MSRPATIAMFIATLLLGACASNPLYQLPAEAPSATLNLFSAGGKWICDQGIRKYFTYSDDKHNTKIAAGERITVGSEVSYTTHGYYQTTYTCRPRTSFVPQAGMNYYLDFDHSGNSCTSKVYRLSDNNPSGLDFEPTLMPSTECTDIK